MDPLLQLCEQDAGTPEGRRFRDLILFDCVVDDGVVIDRGMIVDPSFLNRACIPDEMQKKHVRAYWGQWLY